MMENRYDKYKDSGIAWIGEIPEHWCLALVKSIFNRRTKKNNPILTEERLSLSIEKGVTLYSEKTTNLDRFKEDFTQYQIAYPNDIVLNSMNMIVGAIGISHYLGCVSPVYYVITPKDKNINVKYYGYLLNNFRIRNLYHALGEGIYAIDRGEGRINTCRLKVSYDKFGSIIIPIPSINEQQSIAAYLDQKCGEIDELITLQEEMITKLQGYKQSVITEAVTKGLNKNVPLKDSGIEWIGKIPEHWKVAKIKSFYNVILGKMVERNNDSNTGDENYLCAANIKWNGVDTEINKKMYFSDIEKEKYLLQYNDVLIMEGGMAGTACLYKNEFSPCYVQNSVNVCRAKKDFNNKFLYYWMYVPYYNGYIDAICNKATIRHYTKEKVQNTPILISSLVEQQSIATYLDQKCGEIDELISIKQQKIEKLKEYKKSLIFECVTGKRKVS